MHISFKIIKFILLYAARHVSVVSSSLVLLLLLLKAAVTTEQG
jgi:integral membrane sensor domain MASE1